MSRGINKVIAIGTLGADPEVRYTASGSAITGIRIAVNENWKDKNGEKQERTEWISVTFFGKLAEIASEYLLKGSQVYIEGRLQTDKWEDKDGNTRYTTKVIANVMQMLGGKQDNQQQGFRKRGGDQGKPGGSTDTPDNYADDDIPF